MVDEEEKSEDHGKVWYFTSLLETKAQEEVIRALQSVVTELAEIFSAQAVFRIHGGRASGVVGGTPSVIRWF